WRMAHGVEGRLINDPDGSPMNSYRTMLPILKRGEFKATALFCTTVSAAVGAMRAFYECGYKVGRDVAVCAVNGEGMAQYLVPSVTCLELQDLRPYLRVALHWMRTGEWVGSLLVQPSDVTMFYGESTVPEAPSVTDPQAAYAVPETVGR